MNERNRMILFVAIAALILLSWMPLMRQLGLAPERDPLTNGPTTQPATQPTTGPATAPATVPTASTEPVAVPVEDKPPVIQQPALTGRLDLVPITPARLPDAPVVLGTAVPNDPLYALELVVNPVGGGLEQVVLNDYKQTIDSNARFTFEKSYGKPETAALATRSVSIRMPGDAEPKISDAPASSVWTIDQRDRKVALTLELGTIQGKPVVRLEKVYEIFPRSEGGEEGPRGYEIKLTQRVVNLTDQPIDAATTLNGPTFGPSEQSRGGDRQMMAGYQGSNTVILEHEALESFGPDLKSKDYTTNSDGQPLVWIGAGTNYFNAIVRPASDWIARAQAIAHNPDVADARLRQVLIELQSKPVQNLAPEAGHEIAARVFFGPRLRSLLNNDYYSAPLVGYDHTLSISGSCTFCTFSQIVDVLMLLLGFFHSIFRDWGLAIIALVFLVRALLHPITKRSQINMAKMAKMGPEIERIKKKHGDDKEAMNRAMLEFYKQHGATPILGCLPMFLQMPIWIALYSGLSSTFELRHEPFLYGLTWIRDLSQPDHLIRLAPGHEINFLFLHIDGLNILPILLAAAFYFQFKLQPKPPTTTPEQEQQQKMMKWMTVLLFPIMLYGMPSGLNIYILTSTIFGVIESRIVRKHIEQQEALKAQGIVEGEVVESPRGATAAKSGGGLMGWFGKLQERADQIRADAEKKARQKRK